MSASTLTGGAPAGPAGAGPDDAGHHRPPARTAHRLPEPGTLGERTLLLLAAAVSLASLALAAAVHAGHASVLPAGLRAALAVLAATVLPGVPLVVALRPASRAVGTALATSSSWAVTIGVAQATLVVRAWHPLWATSAIALASLAACAVVGARRRHGAPGYAWELRRAAADARGRWPGRGLSVAALVVACLLFVVQAATVDLDDLGPFGLITAVRWPFLVAVVLVALVWVRALSARRTDHGLLAATFAVLTLVLTSLVSAADGRSSVPTGFIHRAFIDMISSLHHLPPPIDARIDWAGFFSGSAQLVAAAGLHDATALMSAAPDVAGALMIAPLFVIGRALTGSSRTAWIGVLLYQLTNWYQQDYFAPQMVAQLWFVTIVAVLVWWWRAGRPSGAAAVGPAAPGAATASLLRRLVVAARTALATTPSRPPGVSAGQAVATEGLLVLLGATMVVTHQLTPMALVAVLLAFTLTGSTRFRLLWLAISVAFVAWFSFGAQDYWVGNLPSVLSDLGKVGGSVSGGVGDRIGQLPSRQVGQYLRIASSGLLGLLALAGWLRRRGRPGWVLTGALAGIPFGLVAVQSYGGEVVIRCFLLSSPVLAPLAADLLVHLAAPRRSAARRDLVRRGPGAPRFVALTALVVVGAGSLTLTRGLNASFERTTVRQDVVGTSLLDAVPVKTRIVPLGNAPWLADERTLSQVQVGFTASDGTDCDTAFVACAERTDPQYVVLTPEMEAQGRYMLGQASGWLARGEQRLVSRDGYVVVYSEDDLVVLRRSDVTVPKGAL